MVDAKDAEAEEKGDKAVDDEAEKMIAEAEDRVAKAWVPSDIKLEIVDGEKEGSRWLIVDDTNICSAEYSSYITFREMCTKFI